MLDTPILAGIPVTGLARVTSGFGAAWPGSSRPGRASPKGWREAYLSQLAGAKRLLLGRRSQTFQRTPSVSIPTSRCHISSSLFNT